MHRANERLASLLALAAVLLWSTVATGFKLGLAQMTPLQLLLQGSVVSTGIFLIANSFAGSWQVTRPLLRQAACLGLLNPLLYYPVLFAAYDRLPAQLAQAVNYTWAITLAVLAVPMLKQRLGWRRMAGIIVSYSGVLVILFGIDAHQELSWQWQGIVLAFASTLIWALYWLLDARFAAPPVPVMTWSFVMATPAIAVVCGLTDGWPAWDRETLPFGLWVGVVEMGVTFLLWQAALRRTVQSGRLGQLILLAPFVSLLLIERVLGEPVPASSWVGLGIVALGLILARQAAA